MADITQPYTHFLVSAARLTDTQFAGLRDGHLNVTGETGAGTFNANKTQYSRSGQTVVMVEHKQDVNTFIDNFPKNNIERFNIGSNHVWSVEGRRAFEGFLAVNADDASASLSHLLLFPSAVGPHLFYVELGNQSMAFIARVFDIRKQEGESAVWTCTLRNAARYTPGWYVD